MMDAAGEYGMMFFDFQKNRERAREIATELFTNETCQFFMQTFESVTKNYESNYQEVELILSPDFPVNT